MPKTVAIGARINAVLDADIAKLAALLQRSKSWVIERALEAYVAAEKQFIAAVQEGIDAAERGEVKPHEEVMERIETKIRTRLTQ
jgi:predicted transcriptional regulator